MYREAVKEAKEQGVKLYIALGKEKLSSGQFCGLCGRSTDDQSGFYMDIFLCAPAGLERALTLSCLLTSKFNTFQFNWSSSN